MSTGREAALARAADALKSYVGLDSTDAPAEAVINAVLPQITEAKQLAGVPDGSILIVPLYRGVLPVEWNASSQKLLTPGGAVPGFENPHDVIGAYGPLTVVWMP
jgi:hypothetical protein